MNNKVLHDKQYQKPDTNFQRVIHKSLMLLVFGVLVFLLWASLAPISQGVLVQGYVVIQGEKKSIIPQYGGMVERIWVNEGDVVEKDEPLIKINGTEIITKLQAIKAQHSAIIAQIERLDSESTTKKGNQDDIEHVNGYSQSEHELLRLRNQVLNQEIQMNVNDIAQSQKNRILLESNAHELNHQIQIKQEMVKNIRILVNEGHTANNKLIEMEAHIADLKMNLNNLYMQIHDLRKAELNAQVNLQKLKSQFKAESKTELNQLQIQRAMLEEEIRKYEYLNHETTIKSPVSGQVLGLKVFTIGSAIQPGQLLMQIVPESNHYEVTGQLPLHQIDQVSEGQSVEIRFSGLRTKMDFNVTGRVENIGRDKISEPGQSQAYYPIRIGFDKTALKALHESSIQAGVPVEMLIQSGERTFLQYLFKPISDRLFPALTEY